MFAALKRIRRNFVFNKLSRVVRDMRHGVIVVDANAMSLKRVDSDMLEKLSATFPDHMFHNLTIDMKTPYSLPMDQSAAQSLPVALVIGINPVLVWEAICLVVRDTVFQASEETGVHVDKVYKYYWVQQMLQTIDEKKAVIEKEYGIKLRTYKPMPWIERA